MALDEAVLELYRQQGKFKCCVCKEPSKEPARIDLGPLKKKAGGLSGLLGGTTIVTEPFFVNLEGGSYYESVPVQDQRYDVTKPDDRKKCDKCHQWACSFHGGHYKNVPYESTSAFYCDKCAESIPVFFTYMARIDVRCSKCGSNCQFPDAYGTGYGDQCRYYCRTCVKTIPGRFAET